MTEVIFFPFGKKWSFQGDFHPLCCNSFLYLLAHFFCLELSPQKSSLATFVFSTHQKIPCLYFDNDMFQTKDNDSFQNSSTNFLPFILPFLLRALQKTSNEKRIEFSMGVHQNTFCIFTMFENHPKLSYLNFGAKNWTT